MANIAIIPARGGSKRLPGKNIRKLGDKPLIAWTIEAAIASECFDMVLVTTDDQEIASISRSFDASVPFLRPSTLSGDTATSDAVVQHAVEWLEENSNIQIETVTLLQPTSPFRDAKHIRACFKLLEDKNAEGIVSVVASDTRCELCNTLPVDHSLAGFIDTRAKRTQDMQQIYELNGAIYLFRRPFVGALGELYASKSKAYAYVMSSDDSVDIDTPRDFLWAEFCLSQRGR